MAPKVKQNDRFLLLGDSITEWSFDRQGLGAQLSHLYHRKLDIVNRGIAGYNSRWALHCFKQWLPPSPSSPSSPHTTLATLWLGANDSVLPSNKQHVSLSEYRSNLEQIIQLFTNPHSEFYDPETEFVLITPPPISVPDWIVERERRGMKGEMDRTPENTRAYAEEVVRLGQDLGVQTVDAYRAIMDAAEREAKNEGKGLEEVLSSYFWDGLHLSEKGYKQVVDQVKKVIEEKYPKKHWDSLPMLFPDWKTIPDSNEASTQEQLEFMTRNDAAK